MREIKFRALNSKGEFIYGLPYTDSVNETAYYKEYNNRLCWRREDGAHCNQPYKNGTLEQFTGLKDKNGKEIYEGDIIQVKTSSYGEYIAPVAYHTESAFFATDNHQAKQIKNPENWTLEHNKVDSYGFRMDRYSQLIGGYNNTYNHKSKAYDIEIIGNIHQNKELLNDN